MRKALEKFTIYYHNDFDGFCSAALLSRIIIDPKLYNPESIEYVVVDYEGHPKWLTERLKKPCAVLDFKYNKNADLWFDHHETSFDDKTDKKRFKANKFQNWGVSYHSCPELIMDHIESFWPIYFVTEEFQSIAKSFYDWIYWSNRIDSALYDSPKEALEKRHPCQVLSEFINDQSREMTDMEIVHLMMSSTIQEIYKNTEIYNYKNRLHKEISDHIGYLRSKIQISKDVAIVDQTDFGNKFQRYISYYYYPEIKYTINITKVDSHLRIGVGKNPWLKFPSANIGSLCKEYGGGGRSDVGGINLREMENEDRILSKIVNKLNNT